MSNDETANLIRVDFRRGKVVRRPEPEQAEAVALDYLANLRRQLDTGAVEGSLGPLLALSLLDVLGAIAGPEVGGLVAGVVDSLAQNGKLAAAVEVAHAAAGAFIRGGDHQGGADLLELANSIRIARGG